MHFVSNSIAALVSSVAIVLPITSANAQHNCADVTWGAFLDPGPQEPEPVEEIVKGDQVIYAFKFDKLAGQYAKLFIFLEANGTCYPRVVSFGSYAMTNLAGGAGADRVYHGDLYEAESDSTLGFYDKPPGYKEARELALDILAPPSD